MVVAIVVLAITNVVTLVLLSVCAMWINNSLKDDKDTFFNLMVGTEDFLKTMDEIDIEHFLSSKESAKMYMSARMLREDLVKVLEAKGVEIEDG